MYIMISATNCTLVYACCPNSPSDRTITTTVYGGGAWPHYSAYQRNELASNGNYYEPDAIAVRHGICGDPEQVRCIIRYNTIVERLPIRKSSECLGTCFRHCLATDRMV